jgi:hypothetical protein
VKNLALSVGWSCLALLAPAALPVHAQTETDPALRDPDVLYLEDNVPGKVTTTIKAPTNLYFHRNFQSILAVLYPGQVVEILGSGPDGYLIKGTARNNTVTGWIHPEDLPTGFDLRIFADARKTQQRREAIAVAIANKTVIEGMTPDEVEQSMGRPEQVASHTDARGASLTWIFTTYKEEPQYSYALDGFGRAVLQTYYVKIPIGQMVLGFDHGVVASIDQHTTDPASPGVVTN